LCTFAEINRVLSTLPYLNANKEATLLPEPHGPVVQLSEKLFVPVDEYPDVNIIIVSSRL
jgi:hypothetical protein